MTLAEAPPAPSTAAAWPLVEVPEDPADAVPGLWEEYIPPAPEDEVTIEDCAGGADEVEDHFGGWQLDELLRELRQDAGWDRDEAERVLLAEGPPAWMTAPAGPELATALDDLRIGDAACSSVVLIEAMKAAARMQSWAEALKTVAIAAFWRRRQAETSERVTAGDLDYIDPIDNKPDSMRGAALEIAAALRLSPRTVRSHIDDAVRLTRDLPDTLRAVRRGDLTMSKARVIVEETQHLSLAAQHTVQERVLRRAAGQTQTELKSACRRAVAAVGDPRETEKRHRRAVRDRQLTKTPLPDGMAGIWFTHRADVVETVWIAINAMADRAKKAETPQNRRTADQRRADVAADVFRGFLDKGIDWLERTLPTEHRRRPHVEVLIPITALLGVPGRNDLCELAGYGPIPVSMAMRIAADGTWRRLLTDPATGVVLEAATDRHDPPAQVSETVLARDQTCRCIGCRMPARRCDRDHTVKYRRSGETRLGNLSMDCEAHHAIKDDDTSGWTTVQHPGGIIDWISPTGHTYRTHPPSLGPIADPLPERTAHDPDRAPGQDPPGRPGGNVPAASAPSPQPDDDPPPF